MPKPISQLVKILTDKSQGAYVYKHNSKNINKVDLYTYNPINGEPFKAKLDRSGSESYEIDPKKAKLIMSGVDESIVKYLTPDK